MDKNLNDTLALLEARIEVLTVLNDSYSTLLLAVYDQLLKNHILDKKDDHDIVEKSKQLMSSLQRCKLLTQDALGTS